MFFMIFYGISLLVGIILALVLPIHGYAEICKLFLQTNLFVTVGLGFLFNATGHLFKSEAVAKQIGWTSNGFQKELGFVSVGIGICGILGAFIQDNFQLAVIMIVSTFLLGAAIVHIQEMRTKHNFNKGNTLIVLPDILIPLTLIILFVLKKS